MQKIEIVTWIDEEATNPNDLERLQGRINALTEQGYEFASFAKAGKEHYVYNTMVLTKMVLIQEQPLMPRGNLHHGVLFNATSEPLNPLDLRGKPFDFGLFDPKEDGL